METADMKAGPASVKFADDSVRQVKLANGESHFPAAVTLVKLDAYGVAKQLQSGAQHTFGIDRALLAVRLRDLALLVEEGKILPQKVAFTSAAEVEDFTTTTLTFTFVEKVKAAEPVVELPPRDPASRLVPR